MRELLLALSTLCKNTKGMTSELEFMELDGIFVINKLGVTVIPNGDFSCEA